MGRGMAGQQDTLAEETRPGRDYYEVLGVGRDTASAQIERAYESLRQDILQAHAGAPPERVRRLSEAYEARQVLTDPRMRAQYDRFGRAFVCAGTGEADAVPSFEDLFGGAIRPPQVAPPRRRDTKTPPGARTVSPAEMEQLAEGLLKAAQGAAAPADLGRLHQAFFARDGEGASWTFGLQSRRWNRWDGSQWTPGTPPRALSMEAGVFEQLAALGKAGPATAAGRGNAAGAAEARAKAATCQKAGDLDGALAALDQAVGLDPGQALTFNERGVIRFMRKEWGRAAEDFAEAVRLDPNLATAHLNLGSAYGKLNRFDPALAHIDKALALKPDFPEATAEREQVYGRKVLRGLVIILAIVAAGLILRFFPWGMLQKPAAPAAPPPVLSFPPLAEPAPAEPAPAEPAPAEPAVQMPVSPPSEPVPSFEEMFGPLPELESRADPVEPPAKR